MRIQYFGHCAFQITLIDGTSIVLDPFRNDPPSHSWFAHPFPVLTPDVVLVSHPHFDHDNVDAFLNSPTIVRHPLTVEGAHFEITSLVDRHAKAYGQAYGAWNIIFLLEAEGIRLCHWGDNRPNLDPAQVHALGHIDVLMLPVDGSQHILDCEDVEAVIRYLGPKIVFPTHYAI
jgi:L-ascorbate metabolism protein UlaG (beta-lactamase superfamily)